MSNRREVSLKERMHAIFVEHATFTEIRDELIFYIEEEYDPVGKAPPPCVPVVGPSGVGKSTLFELLRARYPRVPDARKITRPDGTEYICDYVPLVCVEVSEKISVKDTAGEILRQLGDPRWNKDGRADRSNRIDLFLRSCETRAVLFDESQRVVDRTGVITSQEWVDWLKARHSKGRAAYVLFGLRRLVDLFSQDSQIDRRWLSELEMKPYRWGQDKDVDLSSRDNFKGLLIAIVKKSPVPFAGDLNCENDNVAMIFFYASRGAIGELMKLLETAMTILTRRVRFDSKTPLLVDKELLHSAYEKAFRRRVQAEGLNPFSSKWHNQLPPPIPDDGYFKPRQRKGKQSRSDRAREIDTVLSKS